MKNSKLRNVFAVHYKTFMQYYLPINYNIYAILHSCQIVKVNKLVNIIIPSLWQSSLHDFHSCWGPNGGYHRLRLHYVRTSFKTPTKIFYCLQSYVHMDRVTLNKWTKIKIPTRKNCEFCIFFLVFLIFFIIKDLYLPNNADCNVVRPKSMQPTVSFADFYYFSIRCHAISCPLLFISSR